MNSITIVLIAFGLAMDTFAISVASGFTIKRLHIRYALRMALFFGSFQALMPIIGWFAGVGLRGFISTFDHWVAFLLLAGVGGKMIYESTMLDSEEGSGDAESIYVLLMLSIATSIDALAVGLSLSFLRIAIIAPALIIGGVTFAVSFMGVYIGNRFGHFFEKKIEVIGGLALIGIGAKILMQHLAS